MRCPANTCPAVSGSAFFGQEQGILSGREGKVKTVCFGKSVRFNKNCQYFAEFCLEMIAFPYGFVEALWFTSVT
jgi:hypothetical protein